MALQVTQTDSQVHIRHFSELGWVGLPRQHNDGVMWLFIIVPIVAALYGVYLRFLVVKYPQMDEPARRKFIYVVGAIALVLIALDFTFAR